MKLANTRRYEKNIDTAFNFRAKSEWANFGTLKANNIDSVRLANRLKNIDINFNFLLKNRSK